ncbi:MAG TPA: aldehyde dehydrogenase family protein [Geobacteraceae bacterium]|nr:aldehyde dehydrogenase family protein [Geobacteraceae bacterium]
MREIMKFYIDGQWVGPKGSRVCDVINPATEGVAGRMVMGEKEDVDCAVAAAWRAFDSYSRTSMEERLRLLQRIDACFQARIPDLASAITEEMGCPAWLVEKAQIPISAAHIKIAIEALKSYRFEENRGTTLIRREPIGVCGLITPWNWPVALIFTKVLPAIATGCTLVLKPSEYAPFSASITAEIMDAAGVPPGVFNLVNGDGPTVGAALSGHPDVDMLSITGSVRAGVDVARNAAATVKRVHQELGGKSPNIILADADLEKSVTSGVSFMMLNSGQSCSAPSRMLAPRSRMAEVIAIARSVAEATTVGPPDSGAYVGPVVNARQWDRVQGLIRKGIEEGATLVAGGPGRPAGLERGYYVRPTVFADVTNDMTIAREEIFGPVLVIIGYDDVEDAIRIANDTNYGLAAYVHAGSTEKAAAVGSRIRAGQVYLNGDIDLLDPYIPFGGFKHSGNGREWGDFGFEAFLEVKSYLGRNPPQAG